MLPGPVFDVEMLTTSRRPRYYAFRVLYGLALLLIVWQNYATFERYGRYSGRTDPQALAMFGKATFFSVIGLQVAAVMAMTPALVAGVIANEKQRKTLHYLLASELSSGEIILGKLLARMVHVGILLAVGLPIVSLLSLFGGVDPREVLLAFGGTLTIAFFVASAAILCSTISQRVREAIPAAYALEAGWLILPAMVRGIMPTQYPSIYPYTQPINDWWYASTPLPAVEMMATMGRGGGFQSIFEAVAWMMGLQVALGSLLVALAIWRLRPVFRAQEGSKGLRVFGVTLGLGKRRFRLFARRPVMDRAMIWKEMYTSRTTGMAQVVGLVVVVVAVVGLGYWMAYYAWDCLQELRFESYFARGTNRQEFNVFLRGLTTILAILACLAAAIGGSNAMTSEREDDTWISLTATPLEGEEIVWPKLAGVLWKLRTIYGLMVALWVVGAICGAVHPLAIVFEAVEVAAFVGFAAALGLFFSLRAKSTWRSQTTTIGVLLVLNGGYLACCCPVMMSNANPGMWVLAGVSPFIEAVTLMAPWEASQYFGAEGMPAGRYNPVPQIIAACVLGTLGYGSAAVALASATVARFDLAADRPRRIWTSLTPARQVPTRPPKSKPDRDVLA